MELDRIHVRIELEHILKLSSTQPSTLWVFMEPNLSCYYLGLSSAQWILPFSFRSHQNHGSDPPSPNGCWMRQSSEGYSDSISALYRGVFSGLDFPTRILKARNVFSIKNTDFGASETNTLPLCHEARKSTERISIKRERKSRPRVDIGHFEEATSPILQVGHKNGEERNTIYWISGTNIISFNSTATQHYR